MSVTLHHVLDEFGYENPDQQIAIAKLLAFRGCVTVCENITFNKNELISKEKAMLLLDKSFVNLIEGVEWLVKVTQESWMRKGFHKEGIDPDIDPVINAQRWVKSVRDSSDSSENDDRKLLKVFKALGLMDPVWFRQMFVDKPYYVAIHGCVEEHAAERIGFIDKDTRVAYYLTNPRGLFNDEPSLAPILASWFDNHVDVNVIQQVLNKHKDIRKSDKNWLKNLSGLKSEILEAIGEQEWPTGKGWYYRNPEPFDKAANAEKRESLAGWPTAMDMVEYLLKRKQAQNPDISKRIELLPVYSVRDGRVANTEDTIIDWLNLYGKSVLQHNDVFFISNNSKGLHYIPFQAAVCHEVIEKAKPDISHRCVTVGPGADQISLSAATEVMAKIFYTRKSRILDSIAKNSTRLESDSKLLSVVYDKAIERDMSLKNILETRFGNVLDLFGKDQFLHNISWQLAENNEHDALTFLNHDCGYAVNGAIENYILKGNLDKAYALSDSDGFRVYVFAREGMLQEVYSRIGDNRYLINKAFGGFACGGRFEEMNKLQQRFPEYCHDMTVFAGLMRGGFYQNSNQHLKALACIDDDKLRVKMWSISRFSRSQKLLQAACRINKLMRQQGMAYGDALSTEPGFCWQLAATNQTMKLVNSSRLFHNKEKTNSKIDQDESFSYSPVM